MLAFLVSFQSIVSFRSGGIPLAAGDVFTAGDYKVTITEIISGSPSGYTGKGYVEQMKLIRVGGVSGAEPTIAQKVAVTLENTVVNDCYELAGGKVVSAYDASWGNVISVDFAIKGVDGIKQDLIELFENFENSPAFRDKLAKKLAELEGLINDASTSQLDPVLRNSLLNSINALKNPCVPCLDATANVINGRTDVEAINNNARTTTECNVPQILAFLKGMDSYASFGAFLDSNDGTDWLEAIWEFYKIYNKCSSSLELFDGGIVPECFWNNSLSQTPNYIPLYDLSFSAGLVDGAYTTLKGILQIPVLVQKLADGTVNATNFTKKIIAAFYNYQNCKGSLRNWYITDSELRTQIRRKKSGHPDFEDWIVIKFNELRASGIESEIKDCEESREIIYKTYNFAIQLNQFIENLDWQATAVNTFNTVGNKLEKYIDDRTGNSNKARYLQGKLAFDVALLLYLALAATKGKTVVEVMNGLKTALSQLPTLPEYVVKTELFVAELKNLSVSTRERLRTIPSEMEEFLKDLSKKLVPRIKPIPPFTFEQIQQYNFEIIQSLKQKSPQLKNSGILETLKNEFLLPQYPFGLPNPTVFTQEQAFIKNFLTSRGITDAEGYATGSRVLGVTSNQDKTAEFGLKKISFVGVDLDIRIFSTKPLTNSQKTLLENSFSSTFGHPLGLKYYTDLRQLPNIPVYGKIDLILK